MITPEEFRDRMAKIAEWHKHDREMAHSKADNLLCEVLVALGYAEGVKIFDEMDLWYA